MGKVVTRRGNEVQWEVNREMEVGGKKTWGIKNKLYIDPKKDGALVRLVAAAAGFVERAHSHTASEVIYVLEGEVQVGDALYTAGDALFIEANTPYGPLKAGPRGMKFLLVRAAPADYVPADTAQTR
ncbi:MAG: cupin domain-containing protein [Chloroflexi bacterium]|nr:cupin domain-containing protein [Chloroflexota bacterium]